MPEHFLAYNGIMLSRFKKWCSCCALVFLLLITGSLYAQRRTYGIRGNKNDTLLLNGHTKIPKELARQVKVRDGYSPDDKHVVVEFLIPPELGGLGDFNNLKAFPKAEAKQRKEVEKRIVKQVKNGEMSIGDARARIVHWKAYQSTPDTAVKIRR